jgi:hypothetical protein
MTNPHDRKSSGSDDIARGLDWLATALKAEIKELADELELRGWQSLGINPPAHLTAAEQP